LVNIMNDSSDEPILLEDVAVDTRLRSWLAPVLGWTSFGLALLPLVIMMVGGGLFGMLKPDWWGAFLPAVWLGAIGVGIGAGVAAIVGNRSGRVTVDGSSIVIERGAQSLEIDREDIVAASAIPGFGAYLQLDGGRVVSIKTDDLASVERMIAALDLDSGKRRFETRFRPGPLRLVLATVGAFGMFGLAVLLKEMVGIHPATGLVFLLALITTIAGSVIATRPPRVQVGADGVTIRGKIGERFVEFGEIRGIESDEDSVTLNLHDGSREHVEAAAKNQAGMRALQRRITLGIAAHASEPAAPARLALLNRDQKTVADWRSELADVVRDNRGYRASPLSRDDLEAILEAPTTSPEHRIGAALALLARDGDEAAPTIRIAAEACAQPQAREALLRVAAEEYEHAAIEEALESSSEEHATANAPDIA